MSFMRKWIQKSLALLLTLALLIPGSVLAADAEEETGITKEAASFGTDVGMYSMIGNASAVTVSYSVTYHQSEARSMLDMVNEFRTGEDAWVWNADSSAKTEAAGTLGELTYDYELEQIAMQRAAEIALSFSHTRPDGENYTTAGTDEGYWGLHAENIAAGYDSASGAFDSLKEEENEYEGQGNRRNMLSGTSAAIGIGCVEYNGTYYWAQEFSTQVGSDASTEANDRETTVSAKVDGALVSEAALSVSPEKCVLSIGGSKAAPVISGTIALSDAWPGSACSISNVAADWSSLDNSIVSVWSGNATGIKAGDTTLTADVFGESFRVPVSVNSIGDAKITLSKKSYAYDGSEKKPGVTVEFESETLTKDTDYTVSYSDNTEVGTAKVTVAGKGNYVGSKEVTFKIKKAKQKLTAKAKSKSLVSGNTTTISASGKGEITYSSSDKKIATVDSSGKVTAKSPGKVTITVQAAGDDHYKSAKKKIKITVKAKTTTSKSTGSYKSSKSAKYYQYKKAAKWKK